MYVATYVCMHKSVYASNDIRGPGRPVQRSIGDLRKQDSDGSECGATLIEK